MNMATPANLGTPSPLPICLFGLDDAGKPHASRFTAADLDRATRAAELMGLHVLTLVGPECGDLAERLPQGRIFEKSGKAFVPFVARPLYERLAALGGIEVAPVAPKAAKAVETAVATVENDKVVGAEGKKTKRAAPTRKPEPAPYIEPTNVPQDWPHLRQGSLVLATTGEYATGWFESTVVEVKDDDLLVLQWRDFDDALFLRRRNQLALLPEGTPLKADA